MRKRNRMTITDWGVLLFAPLILGFVQLLTKTDAGRDIEWNACIGGTGAAGYTGTATATSATSLTATGTPWSTNQWQGYTVYTVNRYANIISNTTSVLTVDQWYDPTAPGGAAGSTPGSTTTFIIMPQPPPSWFMGLTANASAVANGDTTLPGEITTSGGGLIRKIGTLTHTAGASTGTVVAVFTANGTDSLPVTIAKMGISSSIKSTVNNLLQTLLNATATISASGDQLTVTDTITL